MSAPSLAAISTACNGHHMDEGSGLQPGDEDGAAAPFARIADRPLVVEEKTDGANAGLSFGPEGQLLLQGRQGRCCGSACRIRILGGQRARRRARAAGHSLAMFQGYSHQDGFRSASRVEGAKEAR